MKPATKSDHKRLVQQVCHPERSEGSRGQILRCAQNDTCEQLRRKVYQCRVFRFRRRHKKSPVCIPHSALRIPSAWLWWVGLLPAFWILTPLSASAQSEGAG